MVKGKINNEEEDGYMQRYKMRTTSCKITSKTRRRCCSFVDKRSVVNWDAKYIIINKTNSKFSWFFYYIYIYRRGSNSTPVSYNLLTSAFIVEGRTKFNTIKFLDRLCHNLSN
jgi:hypothetical protein